MGEVSLSAGVSTAATISAGRAADSVDYVSPATIGGIGSSATARTSTHEPVDGFDSSLSAATRAAASGVFHRLSGGETVPSCRPMTPDQRADLASMNARIWAAENPAVDGLGITFGSAERFASVLTNSEASAGARFVAFWGMLLSGLFMITEALLLPITAPIRGIAASLRPSEEREQEVASLRSQRTYLQGVADSCGPRNAR